MEEARNKVAINCLAYNHEPYIRDCLEGFIMQKTDFKFVAIVHDDASTDKTADIIREYEKKYPDIIRPIYESENKYSKMDGSLDRIMDDAINATGALYVAMCEGDDYWTDPLKLQKQVDLLDLNLNSTLCHTRFEYLDDSTKQKEFGPIMLDTIDSKTAIQGILDYHKYRIQTCTVVYRRSSFVINDSNMDCFQSRFLMGDTQRWVLLLQRGGGGHLYSRMYSSI